MRVHSAGLVSFAVLALAQTACRDAKQEAAQRSATEVATHIRQSREALDRLTRSFVPVLEGLAPALATPITSNNVGNVRFELIGMTSRQTAAGSLSFYPTGFVAAVGRDGIAMARNVAEADDLMRGMPLANLFPAVRTALTGTGAMSVGELPASTDQPSRVYLVAAAPVRDPAGTVVGVLTAGMSFGQIARSIEQAVRVHTGTTPVLWVGLRRDGRVLPSGRDRDVPARWLVPDSLISKIPGDAAARLQTGNGEFTWTFIENGERGWGAGLGTLTQLENTQVVLFRSEAAQR